MILQQGGGATASHVLIAKRLQLIKIWRDVDTGSMMSIRSYENEREGCKVQQIGMCGQGCVTSFDVATTNFGT